MPEIKVNGTELYYEQHGSGPETIVFAHGLLWSGRMFGDQVKAERMCARIPDSKLVIIPGAGHTSSVEEPKAVNAAVKDFLSSLH